MFKRFLDDIFIKLILIMIFLVMIAFLGKGTIVANISLFLLVIVSCLYIRSCFQTNQLDRNNNYVKIILIIREFIQLFPYIFIQIGISQILSFLITTETIKLLGIMYQNIIIYKLLLSVMAIVLGLNFLKFIKFITIFLFLIYFLVVFIGAFDVKWWAAVTGLLALWHYINSKDFIRFLRNGKDITRIPTKLEYIWQRNRLFATIATIIFYISLIISSFFEKECMTFYERSVPRIYSLTGLIVFLSIIYLFLRVYFAFSKDNSSNSKFGRFILWIGMKSRLDRLINIINFYKISMK
ncbi:hypothetical protein BSR19_02470 [Streptococcus salivarius]|uniref:Beta-carotene 15,15'-monooxygenase n=1 Tax=Streptococcus salivarius TaxID=1304 RepID=A0AB37D8P2_STRSL|nr:hypothetical protein [Streptococcus salivarius]QGU80057.1 hypothetical protein BSR19_02470 [Streptococcus salivarius]